MTDKGLPPEVVEAALLAFSDKVDVPDPLPNNAAWDLEGRMIAALSAALPILLREVLERGEQCRGIYDADLVRMVVRDVAKSHGLDLDGEVGA